MNIGIPKEIINNENRVAMTPSGVTELRNAGHHVYVEKDAGLGSGFIDKEYEDAGAIIVSNPKEAWNQEMVLKVKEPLESEYDFICEGLILFAYLHLANEPKLTKVLMEKKVIAIAYETVQLEDRSLPLLTPMSEVAGYMATQIGAQFLEKSKGGRGILLCGIPGVKRGKVTIIGGGIVGTNAAKMAVGLGANVTIMDVSPARLRQLEEMFGTTVNTMMSNPVNISEELADSDLVIGAVLIPGTRAPKLVSEEIVKNMREGSVIVDVAIDQGGIFETGDRITTHAKPTYTKHGVLHYAVANMPGGVPRTATLGLTNATIPYILQVANKGYKKACLENNALLKGINVLDGNVTFKGVADAHGITHKGAGDILKNQI